MKKLFFETKMTWLRVIILSVVCGVVPGLLMIPRKLIGTSFQQPGISFEFWIFMALFIILNCAKPLEAGLKTFVFFLISQPLIYLVQVPFALLRWQIFSYYPQWGIITLLTLPGGMIAWYTKKGNWLSVAILSVANFILCFELPTSIRAMIEHFPSYLLSTVFIVAEIIFFSLIIFENRNKKIAALVVAVIMLALITIVSRKSLTTHEMVYSVDIEGEAPFETESEFDDIEISISGNSLTITAEDYCSHIIEIKDCNGNIVQYSFEYNKSRLDLEPMSEND